MQEQTLLTLERYIAEWLTYLSQERHYSSHTVSAYATDLKHFLTFLQTYLGQESSISSIISIEVQTIRAWLTLRHQQEYDLASTARAVSVLRNFYRFLAKCKQLHNNAVFVIKLPKTNKKLPKPLSFTETTQTMEELDLLYAEPWVIKRDIAIIMLLYGCGLRISEALSLTKKQFTNQDHLIIQGKGNKERKVPLLPIVCQAVQNYINSCPYSLNETIFLGIKGKPLKRTYIANQLQKLRGLLNLPEHTTPHAFRHSFASHLLQNGVELRIIQELLGHESLATTERYTKIDSKTLVETYNKSHPFANLK